MLKEAVLACHFPGRNEENHEKPQSGFELRTSQIQSRSVNHLTTVFGLGQRKTTKRPSIDNKSLHLGPPKYETRVLNSWPRHSSIMLIYNHNLNKFTKKHKSGPVYSWNVANMKTVQHAVTVKDSICIVCKATDF
jgi:hypothetical protein